MPVEHGGCHGCVAVSRVRPESLCAKKKKKKVSGEPGEKSLKSEALLQGNFAVERLGFPIAAKREREGQALTFGMEIVSKYLTEPFPKRGHFKI